MLDRKLMLPPIRKVTAQQISAAIQARSGWGGVYNSSLTYETAARFTDLLYPHRQLLTKSSMFLDVRKHTQAYQHKYSVLHGLKRQFVHIHSMKVHRGVAVQFPPLITPALDGVEWSTSRSGRFSPWKEARFTLNKKVGGLYSSSVRF
jgi:hypothetical protein